MEGVKFFSVISVFVIACSIAHSEIILTVNGEDPTTRPLELKISKSIEISVVDSNSMETSYDLTLSATGGVFSYENPTSKSTASSELLQKETVGIQASDLANIGDIYFEFQYNPGVAIISLITNQSLTINNQIVPADTEIYQLILFDVTNAEKVVVFGVNYDSLSYEPPVQEESISQPFESESFESMGLGDGDSMMTFMESQQFERVSFANAAECPDLDDDNFVNLKDFAILSGNWLANGSDLDGDFNEDETVDLDDLTHMATYWLHEVCPVTYVDGSVAVSGDGSSWTSPYKYLQDALDNAQSGDEIWVAEGDYYPDEDMDGGHNNNEPTEAFELVANVAVYGGFDPSSGDDEWSERDPETNITVLSSDIDKNGTLDSANSYNVVVGADEAALDGFTITMGYALHASTPQYQHGGGMYIDSVSPSIANCSFEGNISYIGGGVFANDSSYTVSDSIFYDNYVIDYGGAVANIGCDSVSLKNCRFNYNTAYYYFEPTYFGYGGGIFNDNSLLTIESCIFTNNAAYYGGGIFNDSSSPTIINCLIYDNGTVSGSSGNGAAIYCFDYSDALIENCTISQNTADYYAGGIIADNSSPAIINSIVWGNVDSAGNADIDAWNNSAVTVDYTNYGVFFADGTSSGGGTEFISTDPLFADEANNDFYLKSSVGRWNGSGWITDSVTSPCVDGGDDSSGYSNEPEPNGDRINMGAYGNTPEASMSNKNIYVSTTGSDSTGNGTIGNPYRTIQKGTDMVTDEGSVIVTGGLYNERFSFTSGHKGFTLTSTGSSIISGQNGGSVFSFSGVSSNITIENFTIQDGKAVNGGGAYVYNSNNIAFVNCDFEDNQAYYTSGQARGGAVYISNCSPSFNYCDFDNNQAYGASGGQYNLGYGGAIYTNNATATFDYCTIGTNSALNNSSSDEVYTNSIDGGRPTYSNCGIRGGWLGSYMQSNPIPPIDGGGNYTL
ncbi:MAG: hypothetical protein DRP65_04545 [Planctomycetota bacterium]|nr:MAG: hypothetical protein DRP65_04545 [Planctomycetota bacterium]